MRQLSSSPPCPPVVRELRRIAAVEGRTLPLRAGEAESKAWRTTTKAFGGARVAHYHLGWLSVRGRNTPCLLALSSPETAIPGSV